jgi:putative redox protein
LPGDDVTRKPALRYRIARSSRHTTGCQADPTPLRTLAMPELNIEYTGPYDTVVTDPATGREAHIGASFGDVQTDHFSPTAMLAASLGSCTVATMAIAARLKYELDLRGSTAAVNYESQDKPVHRLARVDLVIDLPVTVTERQRQSLERSAGKCPVHQSLHPDIEIELHCRWRAVEDAD